MLESAAMPLPVSEVERELTHTRRVRYEGYKRVDGLWDIEAHLLDTKNHDFHLKTGVRRAGQPIHDMWIRITIDRELNIVDAQATMDAIQAISGLKVNYFALIDLKGFQRLINAVGGVTINVKTRVPIGGETTKISGYIKPGKRHLSGYQALWYARSRTGSSDYERMARQRCVMTAMLQQLSPQRVLLKFQGIAAASGQVISTSIPDGEVGTFVDLALKAKSQKVTSVQFVPPVVVPKHPDFAAIRSLVERAIAVAEKPPVSATASASASHSPSSPSASSGSSGGAGSAPSGEVDAKAVCAAA